MAKKLYQILITLILIAGAAGVSSTPARAQDTSGDKPRPTIKTERYSTRGKKIRRFFPYLPHSHTKPRLHLGRNSKRYRGMTLQYETEQNRIYNPKYRR
jgi:hypothetical protein